MRYVGVSSLCADRDTDPCWHAYGDADAYEHADAYELAYAFEYSYGHANAYGAFEHAYVHTNDGAYPNAKRNANAG